MKVFFRPEGYITSPFANADAYRPSVHTGTDFVFGFKKPRKSIGVGVVYKIRNKNNPDLQQYRTIYCIYESPIGPFEVAYEHCWDILVDEGQKVFAGDIIYTEGNTGDLVYSNGVKVPANLKQYGIGSHLHIGARPLKRVKERKKGFHYVKDSNNDYYQDALGNYFEIRYNDNGSKGWVDIEPYLFVPVENAAYDAYTRLVGRYKNIMDGARLK